MISLSSVDRLTDNCFYKRLMPTLNEEEVYLQENADETEARSRLGLFLVLQRSGLISTFPCHHFCEPSLAMAGGGAAVPFPSPTAPFQQFFHVPLSNFQQVAQ